MYIGFVAFTYDIRADIRKNRLYLRLCGFMSTDEAKQVYDTIMKEIQKLRPGFAVINDIRELKPTFQGATEHMRRAQEESFKRGQGRVIRVVGDQTVTHTQWTRTLKAAQGQEAKAEIATSVEDAERMLDTGR